MLKDKWIITNKETTTETYGVYYYTMILVDNNYENCVSDHKNIISRKNLKIGSFTDADLDPLHYQYIQSLSDVATVESTSYINPSLDKTTRKVSLFGKNFGDFSSIIQPNEAEVSLHRGDVVLVKGQKEKIQNEEYFSYDILRNYTTGEKAANYVQNKRKHKNEYFDKVMLIGLDKYGTESIPATKHIMVRSNKFGYISFMVKADQIEYSARIGDRLLIERTNKNNFTNFEILRNLTIDNMRSEFLLRNK